MGGSADLVQPKNSPSWHNLLTYLLSPPDPPRRPQAILRRYWGRGFGRLELPTEPPCCRVNSRGKSYQNPLKEPPDSFRRGLGTGIYGSGFGDFFD